MAMTITLSINGERIERVTVINRGPVGGRDGASYEVGDHAGGDGLRRYEWKAGKRSGEVLHARRSGALRLAVAVLDDMAEATPPLVVPNATSDGRADIDRD